MLIEKKHILKLKRKRIGENRNYNSNNLYLDRNERSQDFDNKFYNKFKKKIKNINRYPNLDQIYKKLSNFLNIDIQGAELLALKGMGDLIKEYDYLYLEVNSEEVYMGCGLITEIDIYLEKYNFKRVETKWWGNAGWGDAFYIRN